MKSVSIGDVSLHVLDSGSGGGIPILFVHGFPLDHTMWREQIRFFAEHERIIVPDLRGFGQSGVTSGTVTMERFADDLAAMLDALKVHEPVIFCGLSMGGYIAWQFYKRHTKRVRALVLCDTRAVADTAEAATNRLALADRVVREGKAAIVADAMLPKLFAPSTQKDHPDLLEETRRAMLATPPEGIAAALRGMAQRPDVTGQLGEIDVPALVVVGEHDVIAPVDEMRGIADAIPGAGWLMVPHAGHMAPLENAPVFNEALREFIML